jgi:hypothetical protein
MAPPVPIHDFTGGSMSRSPSLIAVLLVSSLALGCSIDADPDLTSPSLSAVNAPPEGARQGQQQVTGSMLVILPEAGDAPQRMSFGAIRHRNGRVTGQFQIFSSQGPGIRVHGIVTCLGIEGDQARLGGVITRSSPPGFESAGFWRVVDNGEGRRAPPDLSSDFFAFAPPEIVEEFCALGFGDFPPLLASRRGNIQVHH